MDASAYNMSFDKEQLSVLCANYDRRIDALAKENAKLREAFSATLIRLSAANDAAGGGFMDSRYCELLRELGIEVDG